MTRLDGFGRHLKGWQLGVVALGVALGGLALALPRPVSPRELPLPAVDRVEEAEAEAGAREMIRKANESPLPFLVRAAGEAFRRYGEAEAKGDEEEARTQRDAFSKRIAAARKQHGDGPVLALRAVQADLFVRAIRGAEGAELRELGGKFFDAGDPSTPSRTAVLEDDELKSLFDMRWMKLGDVIGSRPFAPTLNEWRLYYRTLLAHADLASKKLESDPAARAMGLARAIDALTKIDPDYPKLLALGIAEHWMGNYEQAESLFVAHLEAQPAGEWRLRAQGYVLAARRHVPAAEGP